jgi:hypothetical protein
MKKIKKFKKTEIDHSRPIRRGDIIGIAFVGFILMMLWTTCIANLLKGNYFGYQNYYGQPVGTLLLLVVLAVVTPLYIYMTVKTIKDKKVKLSSTPSWMNKPPWKFPWKGN